MLLVGVKGHIGNKHASQRHTLEKIRALAITESITKNCIGSVCAVGEDHRLTKGQIAWISCRSREFRKPIPLVIAAVHDEHGTIVPRLNLARFDLAGAPR